MAIPLIETKDMDLMAENTQIHGQIGALSE